MIYNTLMFWMFAKDHVFSRKIVENVSLTVLYFACRANRDSKSGTEITFGLVSMPRIQWQYQNLEMSFR